MKPRTSPSSAQRVAISQASPFVHIGFSLCFDTEAPLNAARYTAQRLFVWPGRHGLSLSVVQIATFPMITTTAAGKYHRVQWIHSARSK